MRICAVIWKHSQSLTCSACAAARHLSPYTIPVHVVNHVPPRGLLGSSPCDKVNDSPPLDPSATTILALKPCEGLGLGTGLGPLAAQPGTGSPGSDGRVNTTTVDAMETN